MEISRQMDEGRRDDVVLPDRAKKKSKNQPESILPKPVQELPLPKAAAAVRTEMISKVRMLESTLVSTLESARHELEVGMHTLEAYVSVLPEIKRVPSPPVVCRQSPGKEHVSLGDDFSRHVTLELAVSQKSKGFLKGSDTYATLHIKSELNFKENKHDAYRVEYRIPDSGELPDDVLRSINNVVLRAVLSEHYASSEEDKFVLAVSNFIGVPKLAHMYMLKKHFMTCADVARTVKSYLVQAGMDLGKLCELARQKANLINRTTKETAEKEFAVLKEQAEKNLKDLIDKAQQELFDYRESFSKSLERLRDSCEKEYQAKHDALELEKRAVVERYDKKLASLKRKENDLDVRRSQLEDKFKRKEEELEMRYAEKHAKLDQKLEGHREKVDSDSGKILQLFDVLFPDVKGVDYGTRVDHDLRLYYARLMQNELRECEHSEVQGTLTIMKSIRSACYNLSKRPNGRDIRWIYAGVRAVMEYVGTYDCSMDDVVKKVAALESSNSFDKKPSVEKFLETALGYDFDMEKHAKGLHSDKAKTKMDLGIK